jgi:hypothetical protein
MTAAVGATAGPALCPVLSEPIRRAQATAKQKSANIFAQREDAEPMTVWAWRSMCGCS